MISLIHMHHTNFIGLLTAVHYCVWIAWITPSTGNATINNIVCSISEAFWAVTKFARSYSILVLAIYRLVAVFRITLFKRIVKSVRIYVITVLAVWLVSAVIFICAKFSSFTEPGLILCYDGYSPFIQNSIVYYIITSLLGFLLPGFFTILAYVFIRIKLNKIDTRLIDANNPTDHQADHSKTGQPGHTTLSKAKENNLAKQFVIINGLEVASCAFSVLLSSSNVITVFSTQFYFIRQLFRICNLIFQTLIPVASLMYSSAFKKTFDFINCRVHP